MARLYASQRNIALAIGNLQLAYENGFSDVDAIEKQQDFDSIRHDPIFEKFLKNLILQIQNREKNPLPANASEPLKIK